MMLCSVAAFAKEYTEVVQVPNKNADQLYSSAREWFAETFKSADDVLQMDDPIAGKLIGKGITTIQEAYTSGGMIKIPINCNYVLSFTIKVFVKENRYKYDISDLNVALSSAINGQLIKGLDCSYNEYLDKSEYYKKGSDPKWLITDFKSKGKRMGKTAAKQYAESNKATCRFIEDSEKEMQRVIESLKTKMKGTEDDW